MSLPGRAVLFLSILLGTLSLPALGALVYGGGMIIAVWRSSMLDRILSKWNVAVAVFALLGLFALGVSLAWGQQPVDVALVLAVDASGSINDEDRKLQREGYADAIESADVLGAVQSGKLKRIAVVMFEWGGPEEQSVVFGWRIIDSPATATETAKLIRTAPFNSMGTTSISGALQFAAGLIAEGPKAERTIIDVSGDGPDNLTPMVVIARDKLLHAGVTINGLPILGDGSAGSLNLDDYYADNVIGGEGAFLIPAYGFDDFARAVRAKLMTEVAGAAPHTRFAEAR